ncbi:hypothetical protein CDD83_6703 [Cordyceps sp. RAO-2017]|nr:hypothetical protein CDD83_6703 [Cordyceps sp. RAO-2017]
MKISAILASGLGLALAGPLSSQSPDDGLLSWRFPSKSHARCGGPIGYLDRLCGTEQYCNAFDKARTQTDWKFETTAQCFAKHEPRPAKVLPVAEDQVLEPKLKWHDQTLPDEECNFPWNVKNKDCGTLRYCRAFATVRMALTDKSFTSKAECFANHEPNPSPPAPDFLYPWLQPDDPERMCGIYVYTEKECGTQRYCDAFDREPEFTDGVFDDTKDCYGKHKQRPADAPELSIKLARKEGDSTKDRCTQDEFWHPIRCGTDIYCSGYDINFNETDARFKTTQLCLDAFEDKK